MSDFDSLVISDSVNIIVTPKPDISAVVTMSSPPDLKFNESDSGLTVAWDVSYFNAIGQSWSFEVDGVVVDSGALTLNKTFTFDVSSLDLIAGVHSLELKITVVDFNDDSIVKSDVVLANVGKSVQIPKGTSSIPLSGVTEINITLTVDEGVEITVIPSSSPPSQESNQAFNTLVLTGAVNTGYFIEIEISNDSALIDLWINISYADWDLGALGIQEKDLKIYFFDETIGQWVPAGDTGVDTTRKIIYANIDHLTAFVAVAIVPATPSTEPSCSGSASESSSDAAQGVPGFELLSMFLGMVGLIFIRRQKIKY